jgi:DNA-binding transcriptional MerR regulator/methylmalonyl-CoA mutase cobalamin-binding subunit
MYTIKEAAARAGVSVPLLRAWERRYGVVQPARTAAGYRLYDEASIERVRAMCRLVDAGWTPSQAAKQIEAEGIPADMDVSTVAGTDRRPVPTEIDGGRDVSADFVAAAAALDERRIETFLDDLFAGGSFERVVDDHLMPALRALGDAWAAGTLSVGAEHAASHAVLRRLSASFEAAGRASDARPVLVGLPPGSRHEIAALAFATAARRRGLAVVYLGADVPRESWIEAARTTKARAVVIGIPTATDRTPAEDVARATTQVDKGLLVAIGGPGSVEASVPASVLRLPDGIRASADAFENALARPVATVAEGHG